MEISSTINPTRHLGHQSAVQAADNQTRTASLAGETTLLDPQADVFQQANQAFHQLGYDVAETPFREEAVSSDLAKIKAQYRSMMMASKHSADMYQKIPDGRSHIAGVSQTIEKIHTGYQKKYGEIVKASTQYMQDMNTALGKLSSSIKAGSDGKINFKPKEFLMEIDTVVSKYSGISYSDYEAFYTSSSYTESELLTEYCEMWGQDLGKANTTEKNTHDKNKMREYLKTLDSSEYGIKTPPLYAIKASSDINTEFSFWEKKLSGQGFIVKKKGSEILIYPDFKPIREMLLTIKSSPVDWGGGDMMSQSFQSIQTAIDAQKNAVNSSVSRLLETFRQDNSHFDTLVQLLIQLIKDLNQNNNSLINM
ncbi:hypothetical protein GKR75_09840 [Providencia sp. wls1919]|nr:hypothetical protein [Providencia sp. wls1919]